MQVEPYASDLDAWWRRLPQRPVTAGLLALCILAYEATFVGALTLSADRWGTVVRSLWSLDGSEILVKLGALELTRVWVDGEWWRVVTSGLLHGSLLHLALNMMALGSIGDWVELVWGGWRTLLLFILCSVAGCLASLLWCESQVVVGASAGVLGQAGALWVARRFGSPAIKDLLDPVSHHSLGILILLCLVFGALIPGIAQAGHLGGLGMGLLLGALLARPWPRWGQALGITGVAATLAILAYLGSAPDWRPNYAQFLGYRASTDGDPGAAIQHFRAALQRSPDDASLKNTLAYELAKDGQDLDVAEHLVREALASEPTNASYLDTLGFIWCRQGRPTIAAPLLRAALFLSREPAPEIERHVAECAGGAYPMP